MAEMRFADVLEIKNGRNQSEVETLDGVYPIYGSGGIMGRANSFICPANTVIIGRKGSINKPIFVEEPFWNVDTAFGLVADETKLLPRYLYYFCVHYDFEKLNTTVTIPSLTKANLLKIEINPPDISTQERIVETLDQIEHIIRTRQRQLLTLDTLIKARFVEMFGVASASWPLVTIGDICTDARTGPFGSALHHDEFVDSGVFVLGIDNAVENRFSYNRMRYITEEKYQQLKRYTVHPGDIIITIMGTIGRSAVIPENMPLAINTKHLACLTPDYTKTDSIFLCNAFQMHPDIQRQLTGNAKGAIMDGLNLGIIKALKFYLPPLQEQKRFEEFYTQIDKSKAVVRKALDEAQLLFDSLMQQYFG